MSGERRNLVDERVVEVAHAYARGEAEPDAKRLAPGPACAQPAGSGAADATLELGFTRVERIAERRIPWELRTGDRMQLEQPAQERTRVLTRQVAALDQSNRMREIGQR
jgi:hypothetical protein